MSHKVGRNDPCPCGSGKKYKKCCANTSINETEQKHKSHDGAVTCAIDWLSSRHRKAFKTAIEGALLGDLSETERQAMGALNQETWQDIEINLTEWLIAEGFIAIRDENKRVSEYLLGASGPLFTADQRNWITQLAERPLRLYEVTDVIPNEQITLCDVLDTEATPITVQEKSGSDTALIGTHVGFRIMEVNDHNELSGAVYSFLPLKSPEVIEQLQAAQTESNHKPKDLQESISTIIRQKWLEQFYAPGPEPTT